MTPISSETITTIQTTKVSLRVVGRTPGLGGGPADPARSSDAEVWAEHFERAEGRFPLRVAGLHGSSAFGCDVISFSSQRTLDTFKATLDRALITRFIEVKSGHVQLTENESAAARSYKERYFIYRIAFENGARDLATLTTLCDPLARPEALESKLHVHLERSEARVSFMLWPQ